MARLKVYDGAQKIQELELGAANVSVGRDQDNALVLPDLSVSRRHASVEPCGNYFIVRDNGSTNGTFVNDMLVRTHVLTHGDVLRVGKFLIRVDSRRGKKHESTEVRVENHSAGASGSAGAIEQEKAVLRFENESGEAASTPARLLRLNEIQAEIGRLDDPQGLYSKALAVALQELGADRGSILVCSDPLSGDATSTPRFEAVAVDHGPNAVDVPELVIEEDLLSACAARAQGLMSETPEPTRRSVLVAPLKERGRVVGAIYLEKQGSAAPFRIEDLHFLDALAGQVAVSASNAALFADARTEREKLAAVFAKLTDGVLITDLHFTVVEANPASAVLLGLKDRNFLGSYLFDLFHGFVLTPESEALRSASGSEGMVFQLLRPPADPRSSHVASIAGVVSPYPRPGTEAAGFIVVLRDRTEAIRLDALKTEFLNSFGHKLRSPLTVIEGNVPLLREAGEDHVQILEEVERSSRALCRLVNEFLEFAEMELKSARHGLNARPVNMSALLADACAQVREAAERKGVKLTEHLPRDLPPVLGKAERLGKAFRHILENAIKFSPQGGPIALEATALSACIRVDIVDEGPGIPLGHIESVFCVGHQVDPDRTGQVPGAGLGLTIARHVFQEHGGEVKITSPYGHEGKGTRVSIVLPVAGNAGSASPSSTSGTASSPRTNPAPVAKAARSSGGPK